jgi:SAM-dependent methyltransferase
VDSSEKLIEAAKKNFQTVIVSDRRERGNLRFEAFDQRLLRRDYASRNDSNSYQFKNADILELDKIKEKDFDYVFCIAVLHHLPGEDLRLKALEQMKGKIKPGGKIILTVWNLWNQGKFRKLIIKYGFLKLVGLNKMDFGDILFNWKNNQGEQISRRYYHAATKNELKKIAVNAGLKVKKLYEDKYNYYLILEK